MLAAAASMFVTSCVATGTVTTGPGYPASGLEWNVDRPGSDYRSFELPTPSPETCQATCMNEPQCAAFTYMNPGVQGPNARCWLKNAVPSAVPQGCCVSGTKYGDAPPPAAAPPPSALAGRAGDAAPARRRAAAVCLAGRAGDAAPARTRAAAVCLAGRAGDAAPARTRAAAAVFGLAGSARRLPRRRCRPLRPRPGSGSRRRIARAWTTSTSICPRRVRSCAATLAGATARAAPSPTCGRACRGRTRVAH